MPVVNVRGVGHYRFYRNIVRQNLVVRVQNHAALGVNNLFVNVFFRGEPGVFVVLDRLKINQTK